MSAQTLQKAFIPLAGGALAVYNSSGLAYYRHPDWLGSSRFASTTTRSMYFDGAYAPFGENYAQTGTADLSFTGMNQDTVTNLFDFPAREYNGIHGRWPSPDPAGSASASPNDPQTWNRYAYVGNSPVSYVDATGMLRTPPQDSAGGDGGDIGACVWDDGSNDDPDDPETGTAAGCAAQGGTFDFDLADSDYNPNPDDDLAGFVWGVQNSYVVTVAANNGTQTPQTPTLWNSVSRGAVEGALIVGAAGCVVGALPGSAVGAVFGGGPPGAAAGGMGGCVAVGLNGLISGGTLGAVGGALDYWLFQ